MTAGERFTAWIDSVAIYFSDRLQVWMSDWVMWGIELLLDKIAGKAGIQLKPLIDKMRETNAIPPELDTLLEEIENPSGEWAALIGQSAGGAAVGGAVGRVLDALLNPLAYGMHQLTKTVRLSQGELVQAWLRKDVSDTDLTKYLEQYGLSPQMQTAIKKIAEARLNPETIARLWLRDKPKFEKYWQDLAEQGVSPDRIEAMKELAYVMPTPQELVLWTAHEAFEPDAVAKYGLDAEYENLDLSWFEKVGVRPEHAKLNWRAHWVHPAFSEMTDLLHRGEITDADLYDWYRLVEIPPHWRDKLTSISWDLPNRIELRMMARYGLVDKAFLVKQLKMVGLREDFRSIAADMMLAMGIRTDLSTRYSKGWLDADGVKAELVASGLSTDVADRMYMWIVKNVSGERVANERDLTLTDIYKGIKKEIITRAQGKTLILAMGYDDFESELKLNINVPIEETVSAIKDRELTKTDVLKGLKAEVLTEAEARIRLAGLRYIPIDIDLLIAIFNAAIKPPAEAIGREASKADIVAAVKKGLIEPKEGYMMLQDIGFTAEASEFILMVRAETSPFSPYSYQELNKTIQLYRRTQGLSYKIPSEELIQAEKDAKELGTEEAKIRYHQLSKEERGEV